MRCINCNSDIKKKNDSNFVGRCTNCGHQFAIVEPENGVSDSRLKNAIDNVSDNGMLYYLPSHTEHEIRRGQLRKGSWRKWFLVSGFIVALLAAWLWFFTDWEPAAFIVGLAALGLFGKGVESHKPPGELPALIKRFEDINPPDHTVPHGEELVSKVAPGLHEGLDFSGDCVLICEDERYVDFLLANDFHLLNACPVVTASGYPQALFPDVIAKVKQSPEPKVFVLHHLSPAGLEFVREVRHSPEWFGDHPGAKVVDLGLSPTQKSMVEGLLSPLSSIPGKHQSNQGPGLPPGQGAELGVFRPELLLAMAAFGIVGLAPMALPIDSAASGHGAAE